MERGNKIVTAVVEDKSPDRRPRRPSGLKTSSKEWTQILNVQAKQLIVTWVIPRSPLLDKRFVYRPRGHRGDL